MKTPFLSLLLTAQLMPALAFAACPLSKKEWVAEGAKFVIKEAANISTLDIKDFSAKLGAKNGAVANGFSLSKGKKPSGLMQIQVNNPPESLFLSGVVKCDTETKNLKLLNLAWVKDGKSGLIEFPRGN